MNKLTVNIFAYVIIVTTFALSITTKTNAMNQTATTKHVTPDNFTRISNDTNGNPRYVCHFLNFIFDIDCGKDLDIYSLAVKRANSIGGRKYHTKQYGGGIVFQSYNIQDTCNRINELLSK